MQGSSGELAAELHMPPKDTNDMLQELVWSHMMETKIEPVIEELAYMRICAIKILDAPVYALDLERMALQAQVVTMAKFTTQLQQPPAQADVWCLPPCNIHGHAREEHLDIINQPPSQ
eukprot:Gb_37754 [translate_table: standard]